MSAARFHAGRLFAWVLRPEAALMLCYGVGLAATRLMGEGSAGQPLLSLAAPLAMAVLIRRGLTLTPTDALRIAAVHIAMSTGFGDDPAVFGWSLLENFVAIVCGTSVFSRLRAEGFISTQVRVATAVTITAGAAALASAPIGAAALNHMDPTVGAILTHWAAAWIGTALALGVVLTGNRDECAFHAEEFELDEPKPGLWERPAAVCLVAALILASVNEGRPEAALAASFAMLWFALRLGLFATWLAAFSFSTALLAFASQGMGPTYLGVSDPIEAEMLRYLALALLAGPSVLVAASVHDQKRQKRIFAYRAMHDGLTKLVNRARFHEVLESATALAHAKNRRFALFLIDLDHFKQVNDGFGHQRGDALLVEVATRLRNSVRGTDVVARIGGDEFAVVAPLSTVEDGMKLAKRLVENVNMACDFEGASLTPSITLGGVLSPDSEGDAQRLLLLADEALYAAKAAGRNCWRFSQAAGEAPLVPVWGAEGAAVFETVFLD